jgi:hypothetical protein
MGTLLRKARAVAISGRKWRWVFPCLLVAALAAGVTSCSSGTTATTTSSQGSTTSSSQAAPTTTVDTDLEQDLGSPAQDVMNAVYTSVVNISVTGGTGPPIGDGSGLGRRLHRGRLHTH